MIDPPSVADLQKTVFIDREECARFIKTLCDVVPELKGKYFAVAFLSDDKVAEMNGIFRGKSGSTDVLSFRYEPDKFEPPSFHQNLGDVVISADTAQRQALEADVLIVN